MTQRWVAYTFYFLLYFQSGMLLGFMPLFITEKGFSLNQFGIISSVAILSRLLVNPLVGWFATKHYLAYKTLSALALISAILFLLVAYSVKPAIILFFMLANIVSLPIRPLGDAQIISWVKQSGQNYSTLRIWGSISFLIAIMLSQRIIEQTGLVVVPLVASLSYMLISSIFFIGGKNSSVPKKKEKLQPVSLTIFKDMTVVGAAICQATHGVFYAYATLLWVSKGFSITIISYVWMCGIICEILAFYYLSAFKLKLKEIHLIIICLMAATIRWLGISCFESIILILVCQALQGFTIALMQYTLSMIWRKKETEEEIVHAVTLYDAVSYGGLQALLVFIASFLSLSQAFAMAGALTFIAIVLIVLQQKGNMRA
ncbi:MFS transporter [Pectobacterium parvum]|uniref:MFS transporter n=1 Tax=Pectobacterium TaxID=122277 RepID=UPI000CD18F82|nr:MULTISPECIES: MFS transporter [Pectobacterium]POE06270.1 hypothetical protein BV921_22675 [Pectobacterium odoriferum]UFK41092.1 MFS transporter [Pectobacterium parvum]GKW44177.1 3-phenylpropionic acid transporter [Pectobacterium carotovorum subsp. carotovorum]